MMVTCEQEQEQDHGPHEPTPPPELLAVWDDRARVSLALDLVEQHGDTVRDKRGTRQALIETRDNWQFVFPEDGTTFVAVQGPGELFLAVEGPAGEWEPTRRAMTQAQGRAWLQRHGQGAPASLERQTDTAAYILATLATAPSTAPRVRGWARNLLLKGERAAGN